MGDRPHDRWKEPFKKYLLTPLDRNGNAITDQEVLNGKRYIRILIGFGGYIVQLSCRMVM